jgi:hypothetical protein
MAAIQYININEFMDIKSTVLLIRFIKEWETDKIRRRLMKQKALSLSDIADNDLLEKND